MSTRTCKLCNAEVDVGHYKRHFIKEHNLSETDAMIENLAFLNRINRDTV